MSDDDYPDDNDDAERCELCGYTWDGCTCTDDGPDDGGANDLFRPEEGEG
jgi:hypothetical protein